MNKKYDVEDFRWLIREVIREVFGEHELSAGRFLKRRVKAESENGKAILVNSSEAARMLSISERTLWALKHRGELPHVAIGSGTKKESVRYDVSDLYALVVKRKVIRGQSGNIVEANGKSVRVD
jgi:hypothetical protein